MGRYLIIRIFLSIIIFAASPAFAVGGTSGTGSGTSLTAASSGGVSAITGDGIIFNNSASTGSVTLTPANAAAQTVYGNPTGSSAAPSFTTNPVVGTIGIGTATLGTNAKLAVNGGATFGTYGGTATAAPSGGLIVSGNVGIGTATPLNPLDITAATGTTFMDFRASGSSNASILYSDNAGFPVLQITDSSASNSDVNFVMAHMRVGPSNNIGTNNVLNVQGNATFGYASIAAPTNGIIVAGASGIGTSAPQNSAKLHVNGTIETGVVGTTLGSLLLAGNTSGLITEQPQAAAGTYNWNLPITAGTAGQLLTSGGGSSTAMTWSTALTGSGGTPTCGTGCASITAGSTDIRGSMVSGSSVSSVTLNFSGTLASAPFCTISDSNTSATADISSISTSALTVSLASALTSVTIYWVCPL